VSSRGSDFFDGADDPVFLFLPARLTCNLCILWTRRFFYLLNAACSRFVPLLRLHFFRLLGRGVFSAWSSLLYLLPPRDLVTQITHRGPPSESLAQRRFGGLILVSTPSPRTFVTPPPPFLSTIMLVLCVWFLFFLLGWEFFFFFIEGQSIFPSQVQPRSEAGKLPPAVFLSLRVAFSDDLPIPPLGHA